MRWMGLLVNYKAGKASKADEEVREEGCRHVEEHEVRAGCARAQFPARGGG